MNGHWRNHLLELWIIKFNSFVLLVAIACDIIFIAPLSIEPSNVAELNTNLLSQLVNTKYPLTDPIHVSDDSIKYRIAIVSDLDRNSESSMENNTWISFFKQGYLTYNPKNNNVIIEWDPSECTVKFKSHYSFDGRGLELSELVTFNGHLLTFDDKTGLVYIIENNFLIPWVITVDGDGHTATGMKSEWATIKDSKLYVGSHGIELVSKDNYSKVLDRSNMWIKVIDQNGVIQNLNWTDNFIKLRSALGIDFPGYITHESALWSDYQNLWFFLPRKASMQRYSPIEDEQKGTNVLLSATSDFEDIKVTYVGEIVKNHGFSSFKCIPNTNDTVITAIKTQEEGNITATFIIVFTITGKILYSETKVSDFKFEGLDFI